jgi:hypothetical protein
MAWLRVAATSIALFALLGIGHVLPALHFALVAHRICAEHGELLHDAAPEPSAEAASRSSVPELAAGQHAGHEHDHCGVLALPGSFGAAPSAAWREPSAPSEPVADASAGERPAHVGIALLMRAPKLAPPA